MDEVEHDLDLPGWILTGGCVFQSVWNVLDGHDPRRGILDYDLFYFDDTDLSWENEDRAVTATENCFAGIGTAVEVRNQARVHLWYEQRYGAPTTPLSSAEEAIDRFVATACCIGLTTRTGSLTLHAPFGVDDLLDFSLRPNPVLDVPDVYAAKAERWAELWPRMTVEPWPTTWL
jgi:hypothetical protein